MALERKLSSGLVHAQTHLALAEGHRILEGQSDQVTACGVVGVQNLPPVEALWSW